MPKDVFGPDECCQVETSFAQLVGTARSASPKEWKVLHPLIWSLPPHHGTFCCRFLCANYGRKTKRFRTPRNLHHKLFVTVLFDKFCQISPAFPMHYRLPRPPSPLRLPPLSPVGSNKASAPMRVCLKALKQQVYKAS